MVFYFLRLAGQETSRTLFQLRMENRARNKMSSTCEQCEWSSGPEHTELSVWDRNIPPGSTETKHCIDNKINMPPACQTNFLHQQCKLVFESLCRSERTCVRLQLILVSKITGAFVFRIFGGFLYLPTTQIHCLIGAIISETHIIIITIHHRTPFSTSPYFSVAFFCAICLP